MFSECELFKNVFSECCVFFVMKKFKMGVFFVWFDVLFCLINGLRNGF